MTSTELGYLSGVTSNIQDQLNGKALSSHSHDAIDSFVVIKGDNENTNWASAAGTDGWVEQISNGSASFQWRRLTNSGGNYFNVVTDGWFYQNEGKYHCIDSSGGHIIAPESLDSCIYVFFISIILIGSVFRENSVSLIGSYVACIAFVSEYAKNRAT